MTRAWQVASIALAIFFAVAIWQSLELPLLDKLGPGPGFFPLYLSIIGVVLALLLFSQHLRVPSAGTTGNAEASAETAPVSVLPGREAIFRPLAVLVLIALAALALDPPYELPALGFRLTMMAFIVLLLLALEVRNVVAIAVCAVLGSFGVFHVFNNWLQVVLPVGALGI